MILEAGRDTAAMFVLDALLSQAREDYIKLELAGQAPDKNFWSIRETAAKEEVKQRYYNSTVETAVKPGVSSEASAATGSDAESASAEQFDAGVDQEAFDQHSQKLVEHATWMTHAIIKRIPFVGQAALGED